MPGEMTRRPREPRWTICANIVRPDTPWIGNLWEFYDDVASAQQRYDELSTLGQCPTMRPYYHTVDEQHLHVLARMRLEAARKGTPCSP
jgi:hypothetical protein